MRTCLSKHATDSTFFFEIKNNKIQFWFQITRNTNTPTLKFLSFAWFHQFIQSSFRHKKNIRKTENIVLKCLITPPQTIKYQYQFDTDLRLLNSADKEYRYNREREGKKGPLPCRLLCLSRRSAVCFLE